MKPRGRNLLGPEGIHRKWLGGGDGDLEGVIRACGVLLWPISLHTVDSEEVPERPGTSRSGKHTFPGH